MYFSVEVGVGGPIPLINFEIDFQEPKAINSMRAYRSWTNGTQGAEMHLEHSDNGTDWSVADGIIFQWETAQVTWGAQNSQKEIKP
jgi:hypothetical protein